jgi:hypothetical protein
MKKEASNQKATHPTRLALDLVEEVCKPSKITTPVCPDVTLNMLCNWLLSTASLATSVV